MRNAAFRVVDYSGEHRGDTRLAGDAIAMAVAIGGAHVVSVETACVVWSGDRDDGSGVTAAHEALERARSRGRTGPTARDLRVLAAHALDTEGSVDGAARELRRAWPAISTARIEAAVRSALVARA